MGVALRHRSFPGGINPLGDMTFFLPVSTACVVNRICAAVSTEGKQPAITCAFGLKEPWRLYMMKCVRTRTYFLIQIALANKNTTT